MTINWLDDFAYLWGGAFLVNAAPHLISGLMGRPFQSPFAKPPGQGLSSSTINVLWGGFNLAVAYALLVWVGTFDLRSLPDVGAAALGGLLIGLLAARQFGRFNGGNTPTRG
jgi:hypothetical protein